MQNIVEDTRPIQVAVTVGEGGKWWRVGRENVTKIEAYQEAGHGAYVPWLAIYECNENITFRINCTAVEYVGYNVE